MSIGEKTDARKKPAEGQINYYHYQLISHVENETNEPIVNHL